MRIKQIHMTDYKRFHDLTIDLGDSPRRIVALVGPNGCGKSSVFDAMIFLAKAYMGRFGGNGIDRDYHYYSLRQNPGYDYQNVSIRFDEGDFYHVFQSRKKDGKGNSIFSFRSSFRFNEKRLKILPRIIAEPLLHLI